MDRGSSIDVGRGLESFLNLDPILNSIQQILNDYLPAAYIIAFVLLVVGTMREFLLPETRRFLHNLMRAIFLVAAITFLPSVMEWCDQAFKALAELPAAESIQFGDSSYAIKPGSKGATVNAIEEVLQSKISVSHSATATVSAKESPGQRSAQLSGNEYRKGLELYC
jgi:hypothetical protein